MKAEQRHQLQTNILADRTRRIMESMKSAPTTTSTLVWVFIAATVITLGLWMFMRNYTRNQQSNLFTKLDSATHDSEQGMRELQSMATDEKGSIPGRTARFQIARMKFQDGQALLNSVSERERGIKRMVEARDLYRRLSKDCADAPILEQEALICVAKAEESLAGIPNPDVPDENYSSLEVALEDYQALVSKYPDSVMGKAAKQRAEELDTKLADIKAFYAQLNALARPRTDTKTP